MIVDTAVLFWESMKKTEGIACTVGENITSMTTRVLAVKSIIENLNILIIGIINTKILLLNVVREI